MDIDTTLLSKLCVNLKLLLLIITTYVEVMQLICCWVVNCSCVWSFLCKLLREYSPQLSFKIIILKVRLIQFTSNMWPYFARSFISWSCLVPSTNDHCIIGNLETTMFESDMCKSWVHKFGKYENWIGYSC